MNLKIDFLEIVSRRALCALGLLLAPALLAAEEDHGHDHAAHAEEAHGDHAHESHAEHGGHDDHGDHDGHGGHEDEGLNFTPEVLEEFGIELATAGPGTLRETVGLPGEIRFNRTRLAYATPRFAGTVRNTHVALGDEVKEGDLLATLESVDTLRPFEIKAPFDGVVVAYDITLGQTVEAGASLFTVADLSTVWADLRIFQKNFGQIQKGQAVEITGGHNLPSFRGRIDYVAPTVDEHTRTGLARVVVENPERSWKPGLFIQGRVFLENHAVDILVPRTAVLTMEDSPTVFVQTAEGFEPRAIRIGHGDDESLQVVEGLQAGETYVARNPISLKAELSKGAFGGHQH